MADQARVATLQKMAAANPEDPRPRFGLALEYERAGEWEAVVRELELYLARADDEGNAYGRLGNALRRLGRDEEAREAYRRGIEVALAHRHPTMAEEFEETLDEW